MKLKSPAVVLPEANNFGKTAQEDEMNDLSGGRGMVHFFGLGLCVGSLQIHWVCYDLVWVCYDSGCWLSLMGLPYVCAAD